MKKPLNLQKSGITVQKTTLNGFDVSISNVLTVTVSLYGI